MDFGTFLVAVLPMVMGMIVPLALVGIVLWYKTRQNHLMHETVLKLAEKGQPVPHELLIPSRDRMVDLRRGVVLVTLGMALTVFMYQMEKPWTVGLIPLFMGIGFLVVWKIDSNDSAKR